MLPMNFATKGCWTKKKSFIDATFAMAKGGGAEIGPTKRGKGMKIMAIVDRHGLPLSVSTHAANHHEVRLVQLCFDFYMIEAKPETLIGDRAYDSDPLDNELRKTDRPSGDRQREGDQRRMRNTPLLAPAGMIGSFSSNLMKSANDWNNPHRPTTFGPRLICTAAHRI